MSTNATKSVSSIEVDRGYDYDSGREYKLVRYDDGRWAVEAEGMTLRISKDEKEVRAFFNRRLEG